MDIWVVEGIDEMSVGSIYGEQQQKNDCNPKYKNRYD